MTSFNTCSTIFPYPNMPTASTFLPNAFSALRDSLQAYLPRFLTSTPSNINQPLLDQDEIHDLQLRVLSRLHSRFQKNQTNQYDTAHQRMGDARSIHRGYGLDYEESRPYQSGDDPRYMNWALTARTGELHMKVYREERRPGVFILIDRRASMRFGTRTKLKVTQAARAATCITFAALQRHASVGGAILNAASPSPLWVKESSDDHDTLAFIHAATTACPPTASADEADFGHILNILQALIIPGTQLFLISDFIDLDEQHRGQLLHLASENPVHAIHISDPAEHHLPDIGNAQFCTPNDPQILSVDTPAVQTQYDTTAANHFAARKQMFRSLGIHYTPISTVDDNIETAFATY